MGISSAFDSTAKVFCAVGMIGAMWFIYPAVYLAHYGTPEHVVANHLALWVNTLTPLQQLILVASAPIVGAIVGGIALGIVFLIVIELIISFIKGLFR